MGVVNYTVALILGSVGVAIIFVLSSILFKGASRGLFGTRDFLKFRKSLARLRRFDELVEQEKWKEAVRELENGVVFDALSSRQLVSSIKGHHENLLSRALQVAEHYSAKSDGIATIERLFLERAELQLLTIKANEAYQRIQEKRTDAGKELPKWSHADYLRKIKEVGVQLGINKVALQKELLVLFEEIQTPQKDEIVYH